jgi:hypothetical protein
VSG